MFLAFPPAKWLTPKSMSSNEKTYFVVSMVSKLSMTFGDSYNFLKYEFELCKEIFLLSLVFLVRICLHNFLGATLERCKRFSSILWIYYLMFLLVRALYIFILPILRDSSTTLLISLPALLQPLSYHGLVFLSFYYLKLQSRTC